MNAISSTLHKLEKSDKFRHYPSPPLDEKSIGVCDDVCDESPSGFINGDDNERFWWSPSAIVVICVESSSEMTTICEQHGIDDEVDELWPPSPPPTSSSSTVSSCWANNCLASLTA
uniref:Uncharacterized protein n=1 Tax=Romanomermis culicivorax TaxID=13658 RepID=A0A915HR27_ROMCU